MEYEEFIKETKKVYSKGVYTKEFKIKNSIGAYDVYKHMRKQQWYDIGMPVKEKDYYAIIETVNSIIRDKIANGEDFILPNKMGMITLVKTKRSAFIDNGKLVVTYPIDWNKTLHLWHEDEDAKNKKVLVRNTDIKYYFKAIYNSRGANFNNKGFFSFSPSRQLKLKLGENIKNNTIEAFKKK